jgi:hypothetical protein
MIVLREKQKKMLVGCRLLFAHFGMRGRLFCAKNKRKRNGLISREKRKGKDAVDEGHGDVSAIRRGSGSYTLGHKGTDTLDHGCPLCLAPRRPTSSTISGDHFPQ